MEKFNKIIAELFQIDEDKISDDIKYQEAEKWDSLAHLELISKLEENFNVEFNMDEIVAMETIGKIKKILSSKGVAQNELC